MSKILEATDYLGNIAAENCMFSLLLEKRATDCTDKVFFSFGSTSYTFDEFNKNVNSMARRLLEEGLSQGSVVAILMDGSPEYLTLWFALAKIGAVEVPINTAYRGEILLHQLRTCGATVCAIDDAYFPSIHSIINDSSVETCFVNNPAQSAVALDSAPTTYRNFCDLLQARKNDNLNIPIAHSAIGGIIFTSGTTGPSKGVQLSYRYLTACGVIYADINELRDDDVVMNFLPFFHVAAKNLTIGTLVGGGSMRLLPRLSISSFWDEVRHYGITHFMGVGGICNMLLSKPPQVSDAETTLRTIYAVPDPDETHHELEKRFNCSVNTVFGSTEIGLPLSRNARDEYRPGSCGKLSRFYEVKIVDEFDNELPAGVTGEIVVRPKQPFLVASGYIGMPEKTVTAWRNLWLHSGDSGRVDADGWFYFEDRVSDSMRRRGENISSFEVETLVSTHEAISEVAAVAYPSEIGEDEVRIFVIARAGRVLTPETVFIHCGENMPYFMVPRYIDIVERFPRTPTEKVEKYKLRKTPKLDTTWDYLDHGWTLSRSGIAKQ
ncbi:MAG: AMP-binding protein [Spongiibacteraceae bacterium]